MNLLLAVLAVSLFETLSQSLTYVYAEINRNIGLLVLAWGLYFIVMMFLIQAYKTKGVGYVNLLWSGLTTLMMFLIGHLVFQEKLTWKEAAGAVIIIIGIVVMNIDNFMPLVS